MIAEVLIREPDLLSDQLTVESEVGNMTPLFVPLIERVLRLELADHVIKLATSLLPDLSSFKERMISLLPDKLEVISQGFVCYLFDRTPCLLLVLTAGSKAEAMPILVPSKVVLAIALRAWLVSYTSFVVFT
jgi:hypothetical protein